MLVTFSPQTQIRFVPRSLQASAAADTAGRLLEAGVRGILNFSPITLKPQPAAHGEPQAVIHNINIALELEQIFYQIQFPSGRR